VKSLLDRWRRRPPTKPAPAEIAIDGRTVPVTFRPNRRARRFIVRLDRSGRGVVVTVPGRASRDSALEFVNRSAGWIAERLAREGDVVPFADGTEFPLRGEMVKIVHLDERRGTVFHDADKREIRVAGDAAHLSRRITDWLKAEARRDLIAATEKYAASMGVKFRRISVRDQKSRWGSCAADGSLSYSWRLIMAPPFVLDYVAAHEVAHLREMNHSIRFWRVVLSHCAGSHRAKTWLRANSTTLHRYGTRI
jgi:hypothetical protein